MAKFDLTSRVGQYLDRHLVFPLLEFMTAREVGFRFIVSGSEGGCFFQTYDLKELLKAKLDILSKTNMIDYAIDIRKQLYADEEIPEVSKIRRTTYANIIHQNIFLLVWFQALSAGVNLISKV